MSKFDTDTQTNWLQVSQIKYVFFKLSFKFGVISKVLDMFLHITYIQTFS